MEEGSSLLLKRANKSNQILQRETLDQIHVVLYIDNHSTLKCQKKKKINAILVNDGEHEETITHVNPISVLNCLVVDFKDFMDES